MLVLDLDNFKAVNDTLGHRLGDLLLRGVAERLRSTLREEDMLARLGGDEFAIVQRGRDAPGRRGAAGAAAAGGDQRALSARRPSVVIGASIGIAIAPGDGDEADKLLKNADMALYRAKADGRGTFRFFEAEMDARAQTPPQIEIDLRAAIQDDVLRPHYQPLVDLATGAHHRLRGAGALAASGTRHDPAGRVHPGRRRDRPDHRRSARLMLRRACADAAHWPDDVQRRGQPVAAAVPRRQPACRW